MMRKWMVTGAGLLWIALGLGSGAGKLWAAPQAAQDQAKPAYTLAEYNHIRTRMRSRILSKKFKALMLS